MSLVTSSVSRVGFKRTYCYSVVSISMKKKNDLKRPLTNFRVCPEETRE